MWGHPGLPMDMSFQGQISGSSQVFSLFSGKRGKGYSVSKLKISSSCSGPIGRGSVKILSKIVFITIIVSKASTKI